MSELIDLALPGNDIPRVYADTGIELNMVKNYVLKKAETDSRIVILKPSKPIKQLLEEKGYPFKSKMHSKWLDYYQRKGMIPSVKNYLGIGEKDIYHSCPKKLKYQFSEDFKIRVSDKCCEELKEKPLKNYEKESGRTIGITGVMREEKGRRLFANCLSFYNKKHPSRFQPLVAVSKEWEDWFIEEYGVELCDIYKEPYCFPRTGCKGCPFAIRLQDELNTLEKYFPGERKQCEKIFGPVYEEYRRIGYRLKE